jgi:IS30 family transposase
MKWSPYQIALRIRDMHPKEPQLHVSHETIYTALYAMPRGQLRKELISCLRRAHSVRKPQRRGIKPVSQACKAMLSIHVRPPEIEDRTVPGHWEGDLLVGKGHRSCIGTLVERTTRLVLLVKMKDATAQSALEGFAKKLNAIPDVMRKTLTYDRGSEMRKHQELSKRTGMKIYFADPHSPWQKGGVENMNGLLRQYFPKGTDLSIYSQEDLDRVAFEMNTRPRVVLKAKMPLEKFAELYTPHLTQSIANSNQNPKNLHNITNVALDL